MLFQRGRFARGAGLSALEGARIPAMRLLAALVLAFAMVSAADNWRDQGVLYLDHSAKAALHPVPVRAVRLGDGFWQDRRLVNVERSIPTMLELLEQHGIVDNFR